MLIILEIGINNAINNIIRYEFIISYIKQLMINLNSFI